MITTSPDTGIASRQGDTLDRVVDKVDDVRERATAAVGEMSARAGTSMRQGVDAMRQTSAKLREQALQASDTTVGYVRQEPWKAILIAGAIGAMAMALIGLVTRSRHG